MTPIKTQGEKKGELIQLRVEKSFADQLSNLADRKQIPLSVMLRTWMAEKLLDETKHAFNERSVWIEKRIENIPLSEFEDGPLLVVHAFPLSGKAKLTVETLKKHTYNLVPGYGYRSYTNSEIVQSGVVMTVRAGSESGVLDARGEGFKTGEIESVLCVPSEGKQFFSHQLDFLVVTAVQGLCSIFKVHNIEVGYVIRISLLRIKDYSPVVNKVLATSHPLPAFKVDRINLSEITVTSPDQLSSMAATGEFLLETLDEIAHSAGLECSKSFDQSLKWVNPVQ